MEDFWIIMIASLVGATARTILGYLEQADGDKLPEFNVKFLYSAIASIIIVIMGSIGFTLNFPLPPDIPSQTYLFFIVLFASYTTNDLANMRVPH